MNLTEMRRMLNGKTIEESIRILVSLFPGRVVFTTSFGIEDQVITHIIFNNHLPVEVATLDTGRLFPETYKVFNETIKKYHENIQVYLPDHEAIEQMLTKKGPYSFYYSKEDRLECCKLRKVVPLNKLLKNKKCWITGIRADQSGNRAKMDWLEYDEKKYIFKFHPVFNWSFDDVKTFIKENDIPYNSLHDKGFVSIGCEPCTRSVESGEDFRAGRWWWENGSEKECGVHIR
ncbi:MAG: phosphoadenosine phosphosulfate reductase [Bacteroidetes bacterium RBG_13_43_22]|nr:MAG: phosphoadenosine phosphosulfate reductase [Bacteroidetes bacterium RBG_13_43_22]